MDREVIHILPQEYIVDDQTGVLDPVGMSGVRLEVKAHIVTGAVTSANNIIKCANRAGLDVNDIVLESIASGQAVLAEEEKELGSALIDMGGGTTDLAVFSDKVIKHTFVLPIGGNNLTNDLSIGIKAPVTEAEKTKKDYGIIHSLNIGPDQTIEVPGLGGRQVRKISRQMICDILEPRVLEIFSLIKSELYRANVNEKINSGIVITGGTALLEGMAESAETVFDLPVRIGRPQNIKGLADVVNNPMYATGVGLVLYGYKNAQVQKNFKIKDKSKNFFIRVFDRMKLWLKDIA
jgi:cell division protein FtsA